MARNLITQFDGGISPNSKTGLSDSFRFAKNLKIYPDADSVTLNPKPLKVSGSTVTGLVKWMVEGTPFSTNKYFYDDSGNIYQETSGGTWSNLRTLDASLSSTGQGFEIYNNALYYTSSKNLGKYGYLTGTPTFDDALFAEQDEAIDQQDTSSGNTYALATSINEGATHKQSFVPTKDPVDFINVKVAAKGTGNWTLTLHDVNNVSLGSATLTNGSLSNGSFASFVFSNPIRLNIGSTYHFHVTSTVADGTATTGTASDFETVQYQEYFSILIPDANYHPMIVHTNGTTGTLLIGNNNYIAEYVDSAGTYDPNKITLEPGFTVRYFTKENEYVIAWCWKGTSITGSEEGRMYYWDGIQPYYNFSKPITSGLPNASINFKNRVFSILGSTGKMMLSTEPFLSIQSVPKLATGKTIEVLPGAITVWDGRVHIGIGANSTDSTGVIQGIYEYGNQSDKAMSSSSVSGEVLNFGYTISTGDTQGTTMKIGCVKSFGSSLYFSWKSQSSTYGVDKVIASNDPASTGSYESLIDDYSADSKGSLYHAPQKLKRSLRLTINYTTLPSGCTVTPKYKINRATSWTTGTGTEVGSAGSTFCIMEIAQDYYEIEYGFDLVATTNYPTITGILHEFDPLTRERDTGN